MRRIQRTQIYLEPDLSKALDRLARRRRVSRAALVRQAARELIEREEASFGSILKLAGSGRDNAADVATRHDEYLAELLLPETRS